MINIVFADDHTMFRQAIVYALKEHKIHTLAQASNGAELMEILSQHKPDIILIDIDMPVMDGEETLELIIQEYPDAKVITVTFYNENGYIIHLLEAGARAFIPKDVDINTLVEAIQKVKNFGYYYDNLPDEVMKSKIEIANSETKKKLSKRQIQILPMICGGKTNKEIAEDLNIVIKTVEAHRKIIYSKTNSTCAVELLRYAQKHRLIKA